jgi:hypothetical protein
MKEKKLLQKWIEGSLSKDEMDQFRKSETFQTINSISHAAKSFKAPAYDIESELQMLQQRKDELNSTGIN